MIVVDTTVWIDFSTVAMVGTWTNSLASSTATQESC